MDDEYYMGETYYYRIAKLYGQEERFFIVDLSKDIEEQIEFLQKHEINPLSFEKKSVREQSEHEKFLRKAPVPLIALNLTAFEYFDNMDFLSEHKELISLRFHCNLDSPFPKNILPKLKQLHLWFYLNFENISRLSTLEDLTIFKPNKKVVDLLGSLTSLRSLEIRQSSIKTIQSIENLKHLKFLELRYLPKLERIAPLISCQKIKGIYFQNCKKILDWSILNGLSQLDHIVVENCGDMFDAEFMKDNANIKVHFIGDSKVV